MADIATVGHVNTYNADTDGVASRGDVRAGVGAQGDVVVTSVDVCPSAIADGSVAGTGMG